MEIGVNSQREGGVNITLLHIQSVLIRNPVIKVKSVKSQVAKILSIIMPSVRKVMCSH